MGDFTRFSNSFEPLLLEDMTVSLFGTGLPTPGLNVKCISVGALPELVSDFGALVAATWSVNNQDTNLEMNIMELAQFRMRILDDMMLRISSPPSVRQWSTKRAQFYLPTFPTDPGLDFFANLYWKMSEFFVFEDNTPRFDCYSDATSATSRILFSGWRFTLEKIQVPAKIRLWVSEWPSVSPAPVGQFRPVR